MTKVKEKSYLHKNKNSVSSKYKDETRNTFEGFSVVNNKDSSIKYSSKSNEEI